MKTTVCKWTANLKPQSGKGVVTITVEAPSAESARRLIEQNWGHTMTIVDVKSKEKP